MQTTIHSFLIGTRIAAVIWVVLLILTTAAFVALTAPAIARKWAELRQAARNVEFHRVHLAAQAAELLRYAEELRVAADRTANSAERRRVEWAALQRAADAVWRAYDQAETAARATTKATAFSVPQIVLTADQLADRSRHLHRAATLAHRRGELTSTEYADVLLHRHGWDPRRHPADIEAMLRRAAAERLLRAYLVASSAERAAGRDAELATASAHSLMAEARSAAQRAEEAQHRLTACTVDPRVRAVLATQPVPVLS